jgi:uncharacterized protein
MALSMYQASVPVFTRGLTVLSKLLEKAEAHAKENGIEAAVILAVRLAPDMLPLPGQVQRAGDTSKLTIERLTGVASPRFEDNESTFAELHNRIAGTVAYLNSVSAAQMEGSEQRKITRSFGSGERTFGGDEYLMTFGVPNFFFHITTAYDIIRHVGVKIGKLDYLGPYA